MKRLIYSTLLLPLLFSSCEKKGAPEKMKISNVELAPPLQKATISAIQAADQVTDLKKPGVPVSETSRKIIKEGDINFETNDVKRTRNLLNSSLEKLGGYVGEEKETNNTDNNRKEYTLNVRVPAKNFDQFLNGVVAIAEKIDSKNISSRDVTTEYIDITTQLANKKILEQRYLELLKKATRMTDMLEIENKLTEIRTDIEATQGKLNYMVKQVEYSSLDITFYTKQLVQDNGNTFGYRLGSSLSGGWEILGIMFFGAISVWPFWIVLVAVLYIARKINRKNRQAKAEKMQNNPASGTNPPE